MLSHWMTSPGLAMRGLGVCSASFGRSGWKVDKLGAGLDDEAGGGDVGAAEVERDETLVERVVFFLLAAVAAVVRVVDVEAVGLVVRAALELRAAFAVASSSFFPRFALMGERSSRI